MLSARYWYSILTKVGICRQSFVQIPKIQFHVNLSSNVRVLCMHPDWSTGKYSEGDTGIFCITLLPTRRKLKSFIFFCYNVSRYAENCYSWDLSDFSLYKLVDLSFKNFSALLLSFTKWLVSLNLFHFLFSFPVTLLGHFPKRISWQHSIISSSTHYER